MTKRHKRHKKVEIQERRRKVAILYLQHHMSQEDIARALGIHQSTVSRDLKALEEQWQKEAMQTIEKVKARELAELDMMEREAALQYQQTKSLKWFNARLKIKERRARLLGLDAPVTLNFAEPFQIVFRWEDDEDSRHSNEEAT